MKRGKKRLNAKLKRYIAGSHALSHKVFVLYIYIYVDKKNEWLI